MKVKELIEELGKYDQESNVWLFDDYPNRMGWEPGIDSLRKIDVNYIMKRRRHDDPIPSEGDVYLT